MSAEDPNNPSVLSCTGDSKQGGNGSHSLCLSHPNPHNNLGGSKWEGRESPVPSAFCPPTSQNPKLREEGGHWEGSSWNPKQPLLNNPRRM